MSSLVGTSHTGAGTARRRSHALPAHLGRVHAWTVLLACAGVVAGLLAQVIAPAEMPSAGAIAALAVVLVVAGGLTLEYRHEGERDVFDLFEVALVPTVFLLPGAGAVLLAAAAKAVLQAWARMPLVKAAFNTAQWAAATGTACLVFAVLEPAGRRPLMTILALSCAMLAGAAVNVVAVAVLFAALPGVASGRMLRFDYLRHTGGLTAVSTALGLLATLAAVVTPVAVVLVLGPVLLLHRASKGYALEHADLRRMRSLQRATSVLAAAADPRDQAGAFLDEVVSCFDARSAAVVARDEESGVRTTRRPVGTDSAEADRAAAVYEAVLAGPLPAAVAAEDEGRLPALLRAAGWQNCLAVPLTTGAPGPSMLCVVDRGGFAGSPGGDLLILEALGRELSGVTHRAQLLDAVTHSQRLLTAQARMLEMIATDEPLPHCLTAAAEGVDRLIEGGNSALFLCGEEGIRPVGASVGASAHLGPLAVAANSVRRSRADAGPDVVDLTATGGPYAVGWVQPWREEGGGSALGALVVGMFVRSEPGDAERTVLAVTARLAGIALDRHAVHAELAHQALHDPLTSLPNRNLFLDRCDHALDVAGRHGNRVAILFLDLDRFKVVNDSLGHQAGDTLLTMVGERLCRILRPEDTVARIGGDEFAVLCERVSTVDQVESLAERVEQAFRAPFVVRGQEIFETASVGIAIGDRKNSAAELIEAADAAMYRAKAAGGNRYEFFDPALRLAAQATLGTYTGLRRAVDSDEFRVVYQPTVSLDGGRLLGVEALLRWQHPSEGELPPAAFLPVAEATGLIVPIGSAVLRESLSQLQAWDRQAAGCDLQLAVNLSGRQLVEPGLVDEVRDALDAVGIEPGRLILEITESVMVADVSPVHNALRALKDTGVKLSIDDFGTGHSSLSYLRRLPVDVVKVDRSFVLGMTGEGDDDIIVAAVVSLAHNLGLTAVAEGIETAEQLQRLKQLRCDVGQGYLFGRPQAPDAIASLLEDGSGPPVLVDVDAPGLGSLNPR